MKITITQKDIIKLNNSTTGEVIDELAYSAGEWTSDDLYANNINYELVEPYNFDYESDLLANTKKFTELYDIAIKLKAELNLPKMQIITQELQAGAWVALHLPDQFSILLEAYTDYLKEHGTEQDISKDYTYNLQLEINDYYENLYNEWLKGERSNSDGVIYLIAKHFTESRQGEYDRKSDEYTFTLDADDIQNYKEAGYTNKQMKGALLDEIASCGKGQAYKDEQLRNKRKAERERLAIYKAEQQAKNEATRKATLLSMTLNK